MSTLDLHVIHCGERADWLSQCLRSIHPWTVRVYDGMGRSTAENRALAIGESRTEFIGWVDPSY